jgi:hypothetical protein
MRVIWPAALNFVVGLVLALIAQGFLHNVGIGLCAASGAIALFGWLSQRQSSRADFMRKR